MMNSPADMESPRPSSVASSHSSFSTASSHKFPLPQEICVGEELKISVHIALEKFRMNEEQKELEFPSSLTSTERAYIHRVGQHLDLKTKSVGRGSNRYITVSKKRGSQYFQTPAAFSLSKTSRHQVYTLIQRYPLNNKERMDLTPRMDRSMGDVTKELSKTTPGRLNTGVPQVPPPRGESEYNTFRETLPVVKMKEEILRAIYANKVTLICGATGSGKTTQVPQLILDECCNTDRPCRIICTQPRRISAVSVAERVANERNEKMGQTIGYQIRLESRVSPKTLLTYCTNGVLLRTLMGGDGALQTVTHIIVDEIHERDRFCDFLLTALRDIMSRNQHIKLVMMSAAFNVQLFVNYFSGCPVVNVPGRMFDVQQHFLEDILRMTAYTNKRMQAYQVKQSASGCDGTDKLSAWCDQLNMADDKTSVDGRDSVSVCSSIDRDISDLDEPVTEIVAELDELEPWLVSEMDNLLSQAWLSGEDDAFGQIIHLVISENVSVDYAHSETSATPLMVAAGRGHVRTVDRLLTFGANVNIRATNGWTAQDWAKRFDRTSVIDLLESYSNASQESRHEDEVLVARTQTMAAADKELLEAYHHSFDDDNIDTDLVMALLKMIHSGGTDGAVLIMLPGYDSIMKIKDEIQSDDSVFGDSQRYALFLLHSNIQTNDQKRVFRPVPCGVRKLILATNIAESSITVDDVVFIIDSGKVNEKSYDALTSITTLKCNWISKANVLQRKGRAGRCRPGVSYHLYSRARYDAMQEYQDPEILRFPLQELCLHTKLLAPVSCPIADFLAKAPDPPAFLLTRNSVALLKQIDALDPWEDLTEIGHHLTDLPVEPKYGKMILYSVVLKCLDPVLTIACTLAYKDPFVLPTQPSQKRASLQARKQLSAGTFSDHMSLLRAFQAWQRAKADGWEVEFCRKNFISRATMEMILNMRTQLLGQLRASGFVRARGGGDIRDLNTNSECWPVVKGALLAGHYPNIIRLDRVNKQFTTLRENRARSHPSSVLSPSADSHYNTHQKIIKHLPSDWLIYDEMTRAQRLAHVKCNTVVSAITVVLFAGPSKLPHDAVKHAASSPHLFHQQQQTSTRQDCGYSAVSGAGGNYGGDDSSDSEGEKDDDYRKASLTLDDWISFHVESDVLTLALNLRQKWHSLFLRRMRAPAKPWSQVDEATVRAVVSVITNEELSLGLQQPSGIGQRPRPMSSDSLSPSGADSRRGSYGHDNPQESGQFPDPSVSSFTTPPSKSFLFRSQRSESSESSTSASTSDSRRGSNGSTTSPDPARYYVMRCQDQQTIDTALATAVWTMDVRHVTKFNEAFQTGRPVYLFVSVQNSNHFTCYGQMTSIIPPCDDRTCATVHVNWIKRSGLLFSRIRHLLNPWDKDRQIQFSQDGQELEPTIGDLLVQCWRLCDNDSNDDIGAGADMAHGGASADVGHGDAGEDKDITPTPGYARGFRHRWTGSPQYAHAIPAQSGYNPYHNYGNDFGAYTLQSPLIPGQFYNQQPIRGIIPGVRPQTSPRQSYPSGLQRGNRSPLGPRPHFRSASPRGAGQHSMFQQQQQRPPYPRGSYHQGM